ncbi:unnamed protein product [Amoebophrya sp. A120]|nr:unnamed protein product [Amoebophrya sp. A120]|eukprot:GSA120T00005319001.1
MRNWVLLLPASSGPTILSSARRHVVKLYDEVDRNPPEETRQWHQQHHEMDADGSSSTTATQSWAVPVMMFGGRSSFLSTSNRDLAGVPDEEEISMLHSLQKESEEHFLQKKEKRRKRREEKAAARAASEQPAGKVDPVVTTTTNSTTTSALTLAAAAASAESKFGSVGEGGENKTTAEVVLPDQQHPQPQSFTVTVTTTTDELTGGRSVTVDAVPADSDSSSGGASDHEQEENEKQEPQPPARTTTTSGTGADGNDDMTTDELEQHGSLNILPVESSASSSSNAFGTTASAAKKTSSTAPPSGATAAPFGLDDEGIGASTSGSSTTETVSARSSNYNNYRDRTPAKLGALSTAALVDTILNVTSTTTLAPELAENIKATIMPEVDADVLVGNAEDVASTKAKVPVVDAEMNQVEQEPIPTVVFVDAVGDATETETGAKVVTPEQVPALEDLDEDLEQEEIEAQKAIDEIRKQRNGRPYIPGGMHPSTASSSSRTSSSSDTSSDLQASLTVPDRYMCRPKFELPKFSTLPKPERLLRQRWLSLNHFCQNLQLAPNADIHYRVCFGEGFTATDMRSQESIHFGAFRDDLDAELPVKSKSASQRGASGMISSYQRLKLVVENKEKSKKESSSSSGTENSANDSTAEQEAPNSPQGLTYENPGEYYYSQLFYTHRKNAHPRSEPDRVGAEVQCFCGSGSAQFYYLDLIADQDQVLAKTTDTTASVVVDETKNDESTSSTTNAQSSTSGLNITEIEAIADIADEDDIGSLKREQHRYRVVAKLTHPVCCKHIHAGQLLSGIDTPIKATVENAADAFERKIIAASFFTRLKLVFDNRLYVVPYNKESGTIIESLPRHLLLRRSSSRIGNPPSGGGGSAGGGKHSYGEVFGGVNMVAANLGRSRHTINRHPALRYEITDCPGSAIYFVCPLFPERVTEETGSHTHIAFITDGFELSEEFLGDFPGQVIFAPDWVEDEEEDKNTSEEHPFFKITDIAGLNLHQDVPAGSPSTIASYDNDASLLVSEEDATSAAVMSGDEESNGNGMAMMSKNGTEIENIDAKNSTAEVKTSNTNTTSNKTEDELLEDEYERRLKELDAALDFTEEERQESSGTGEEDENSSSGTTSASSPKTAFSKTRKMRKCPLPAHRVELVITSTLLCPHPQLRPEPAPTVDIECNSFPR